MEQRQPIPPSAEELEAYSLGKTAPQRAAQIEAFLRDGPDQGPILTAAPDDVLVEHLRGAGVLPKVPAAPRGEAPSMPPVPDPSAEPGAGDTPLLDHPRYRLIRPLGQGGMGTVYLAEHRLLRRLVALKVIRAGYLDNPRLVARFRQEAEAAARLSHPHIVTVYDADEADGIHFLVMEFVEGVSLADWLCMHGPLPVREACEYVRQAALGLQCAHEQGMVHRDVKPHNLMRRVDGTVKVLDFGLARVLREAGSSDGQFTTSETVMGTADYIAPEQGRDSRNADVRADIYGLGCTLYHLLAGRVPFPGGTAIDKIIRHATQQAEPISRYRPDVPPRLVAVLGKMMARQPEDRDQTPADVAAALAPFTQPGARGSAASPGEAVSDMMSRQTGRGRRRRAAVLGAVLLVGAALALFALWRLQPERSTAGNIIPGPAAEPSAKIEQVRKITLPPAVADRRHRVAISAGGKYVLAARDTGTGFCIDVFAGQTGGQLFEFNHCYIAEFLGDGEQFVLHTNDHLEVHESRSGELLRRTEQEHRGVWSFKVAPGGRHLLYWGENGYGLIDLLDMRELQHWAYKSPGPEHPGIFQFTPDDKRLILSLGRNDGWTVWDLEANRRSEDLAGLAGVSWIHCLSPDGATASVRRNGEAIWLDLHTGQVLDESRNPEWPARPVAGIHSSRGRGAVVRCQDGSVIFYRLPFDGKVWGGYRLPADDLLLSREEYEHARLALSEDDRYAVAMTTQSLYVLRLPELSPPKPN